MHFSFNKFPVSSISKLPSHLSQFIFNGYAIDNLHYLITPNALYVYDHAEQF